MYRPTVRYADVFKDYVDSIFHSTHLDRNQIIRAALFSAAHSKEFHEILKPYRKGDVPTSPPPWKLHQDGYWLEQCPEIKEEGKDVNVNDGGTEKAKTDYGSAERNKRENQQHRRLEPATRREGAVHYRENGGITIRIG